jgi:Flp pilus assembly protein TadD
MAEALLVAGRVAEVRTALRREGLNVAGRYTQAQHGNALLAAFREFVAAAAENNTLRLVPNRATPPDIAGLCQQLQTVAADKFAHGDHATAARLWQAACCLQPDDDTLLRRSAEALQLAGDHSAALQACDQLLARGHEDEALHTARGHALHALGQMGEAAQAFRAALAVGVRTADAYNRLGVVLFQAGDVAAARASFERALVLQPGHGDAAANLHALPAA